MKPKKYFLILLILILTQSINADKDNIKYGVNVSKVQGNTARYRYFATFDVWLKSQPRANVTIPLSSSDINEGKIVEGDKLIFTSDNWNRPQTVVVQGQNQNVVNGIQNYTIILDSIISDDDNYNGINPDDVEMKGLELVLKQQEDLTCIAGFKKRIKIESKYNGQKSLSYTLIEKPDGMVINTRTGKISWSVPQTAEGSSYPVKVKVSDGLFTREMSFRITVVTSSPIETEVNGRVVTVTDVNHLNGFKFRFTEGLSMPTIKTISEDSLPLLSNGITRLSDYFYSLDEHDGRIEILIPISILSSMNDLPSLSIYHFRGNHGWSPTSENLRVETVDGISYILMSVGSLKALFFLGVRSEPIGTIFNQKLKHIQKKVANPIALSIDNIHCIPELIKGTQVRSYQRQTCNIDGIQNTKFTVVDFGNNSGRLNMWNPPTSIEEMMIWIGESRSEYATNLGLGILEQNITIRLDGANDNLGYVDPKDLVEQGNVLHLSETLVTLTGYIRVNGGKP